MAKDSRFKWEYRKNASRLHKVVGELFRSSTMFAHYECYQEYPVNRVNTSYQHGSHHVDWVIPQLLLVIECHGKQHYQAVAFDGNIDRAVEEFKNIKYRDKKKKAAALAADFTYVEIPYTSEKTLTIEILLKKIKEADDELSAYREEHAEEIRLVEEAKANELAAVLKIEKQKRDSEARKQYLDSQAHQQELKTIRGFRQKHYRKLKELKDRLK